jgi:hypothetical protein
MKGVCWVNSHQGHGEPALESVVKVSWCERCFGWHCKRSWLRWSTGEPYAPWIGHEDTLFVPADDWAQRNLMKWMEGAAQTVRNLERASDSGQEPLSV